MGVTMTEDKIVVQPVSAYCKLYKNTKNYNWEIKLPVDTDPKEIDKIITEIEMLNNTMLNKFGGYTDGD